MAETTQASLIVDLAENNYHLGRAASGDPYAVGKDGPNIAVPFRGRSSLRTRLAAAFREAEGRPPSANALADALAVLEGQAADSEPVDLPLRVAPWNDGIVLDLGTVEGEAVTVGADGWEIVTTSPVTFARSALTAALPRPIRPVQIGRPPLRDLLNVDDKSWDLLVGWMVAAMLPDVPVPILLLGGLQGSGKTTAARAIVDATDPAVAPVRAAPRDVEQWAIQAAGSRVVALDNISFIGSALSDALCRAVTGDGLVRRALYTDRELSVLSFRRAIILTSIDAGALAGDLAERIVRVDLAEIKPGDRKTDADLVSAYATKRAESFGWLLEQVAAVLADLPFVRLDALPRMADFARVLAALDKRHGTQRLKQYSGLASELAGEVVDGDAVGSAVVALGDFAGTPSELLDKLTPEPTPKGWPKTASSLSGKLKRLTPSLRARGVDVDFERTGTTRKITIKNTGIKESEDGPSSSSRSSDQDEPVTRPGVDDASDVANDAAEVAEVVPLTWTNDADDGSDDASRDFLDAREVTGAT